MQRGFTLIEVFIVAAILAILFAIFALPPVTCANTAAQMGVKHQWGPLTGCMIEHRPGKWIPLRNYRALDD